MWSRILWCRPFIYSKRSCNKILLRMGCFSVICFVVYLFQKDKIQITECTRSISLKDYSISTCPQSERPEFVTYDYTVRPEEIEFPLAFSLLIYTDADRAVRLLRAIYRPHNHYCIHIDKKSSLEFIAEIKHALQFPDTLRNVYLVPESDRLDAQWGRIAVLDAELACARVLLQRERRWKYWINLTGQEFPLRTNWELVAALKALNGGNIVEAIYKRRDTSRFPPSNYLSFKVTWFKGSVHVATRREFVDYMVNNPRAKEIYAALRRDELARGSAIVADETFFATLNHNPETLRIPGAFIGEHEEHVATALARAKIWQDYGLPCGSGYWLRHICIYGLADLPFLIKQPHLFANKFLHEVEPLAYDILELWHASKIKNETLFGRLAEYFNISYYSSHPYATQHL